jgi:hypothetical protein
VRRGSELSNARRQKLKKGEEIGAVIVIIAEIKER